MGLDEAAVAALIAKALAEQAAKQAEEVKGVLAKQASDFEARLAKVKADADAKAKADADAKAKAEADAKGADAKGADTKGKPLVTQPANSPEMDDLRQQVARLTAEAAAEKATAQRLKTDGALAAALGRHFGEAQMPVLRSHFRDQVKVDEATGEPYVLAKNKYGQDEAVALAAYVDQWATSDEGKAFLPPKATAAGVGPVGQNSARAPSGTPLVRGVVPDEAAARASIGAALGLHIGANAAAPKG